MIRKDVTYLTNCHIVWRSQTVWRESDSNDVYFSRKTNSSAVPLYSSAQEYMWRQRHKLQDIVVLMSLRVCVDYNHGHVTGNKRSSEVNSCQWSLTTNYYLNHTQDKYTYRRVINSSLQFEPTKLIKRQPHIEITVNINSNTAKIDI